MTEWLPIPLEELRACTAMSESEMTPDVMRLWELLRIPPVKWQLHPWGDKGGGFWVVGVIGSQVVWYNDIEEGFNVSPYSTPGVIDEYWCNDDELHHAIYKLSCKLHSAPPKSSDV